VAYHEPVWNISQKRILVRQIGCKNKDLSNFRLIVVVYRNMVSPRIFIE